MQKKIHSNVLISKLKNIYFSKYIEAKYIIENNIEADPLLQYPFTTGYAELHDLTLQESAKRIMFQHDTMASRLAETENFRLKYSYIVRDNNDITQLKSILNAFMTESTQYSSL